MNRWVFSLPVNKYIEKGDIVHVEHYPPLMVEGVDTEKNHMYVKEIATKSNT